MPERRKLLGDILLEAGLVTKSQLDKALEAQKQMSVKEPLGVLLIRMGLLNEEKLASILSRQLNIPFVARADLHVPKDAELAKAVPEEFARKHLILPISVKDNTLKAAFADPTNILVIDDLRLMTGCQKIDRVLATGSDISFAIDLFYGEGGMLKKAIEQSQSEEAMKSVLEAPSGSEQWTLDNAMQAAEAAPVIQMTDLILRQAIKMRASDIHIEPFDDGISLRYRIDGVLQEMPPPARSMAMPIVSRIKILSSLDISEKRLPQDGHFKALMELNRLIDFRVSTVPTIFGEKVVIRILDKSMVPLNLAALGFQEKDLEEFRRLIQKPYGLILVTGPTGSGKTTTLYAALNELKTKEKNIMTVEDPVEYQMKGINQVQVKPDIGLTFATGLRAFLRQDPDIILVGETRDLETAQICIRAALTGHLVFSTLHTNDAASSINRLIDIGIEPFYISASLLMVIAQRLVRKLCVHCKVEYKPDMQKLPDYFSKNKELKFFRAEGCEKCSKTGYLGRMAIHEVLIMNETLEPLINQKAGLSVMREAARKTGMRTLRECGYEKVLRGETSIEEIHSVTMTPDSAF